MSKRLIYILLALFTAIIAGCGDDIIVEDPPRNLLFWDPPEDFRPSYIRQDESGTYWGLFVSRRYSGKHNLWIVNSNDREKWVNPLLVENAYYFEDLDFEVRNDSLFFIYYEIAPEYFPDHGLGLAEFVDYKDELELSYALNDLRADRDIDSIPDNVEAELLLSNRLPDTDLDGKLDRRDMCPHSKPIAQTTKHKIIESILKEILVSSGLDTLEIEIDQAWSRFFGLTTLKESYPFYVSLSEEWDIPEFVGFPMPLVITKSPLWFYDRQRYKGFYDGTIPHIDIKEIEKIFMRNYATALVRIHIDPQNTNDYEFVLSEKDGLWQVDKTLLIESEDTESEEDTAQE
jgi:hypothetical protein